MANIISVTQVNNYIKNVFDSEVMLQNICIVGEVSSYSVSNNIAYFNIKDENSILNCVMFNAKNFITPNIGDQVLVTGGMNYYVKGGRLSFNVTKLEAYGKGLIYEKFLQLKNELEAKGYFAAQHKKPLPKRIKRMGVVSSLTGAVIQDIRDVTWRRNDGVDIVLYPVKVQGIGAEHEIAAAIKYFSETKNVDLVIVARGGGSLEDLQPFNTEVVASAVFDCELPLISAVGHETDYTIIDFVADLRAPTPSAAAELAVWDKCEEKFKISKMFDYVHNAVLGLIEKSEGLIDRCDIKIFSNITQGFMVKERWLSQLSDKLNTCFDYILKKYDNQICLINNSLVKTNPQEVIKNGYAILEDDLGRIDNIKKLKVGKKYKIIIEGGSAQANIETINKN